jgi:DNA-binding MarR family transcriptional regulator
VPEDAIDRVVAQWRAVRPDLGADALSAMALILRLGRVAAVAGPRIEAVFARFGLTTGEFDVLAALRRAGNPPTLTPSGLARGLALSPAAMTHRLDRLEGAGLVTRRLDPGNRRSVLVTLTGAGGRAVDTAVGEHVAHEQRLLAGLTADERAHLDALLRTLLGALDDPAPGSPGAASPDGIVGPPR